MRVFLSLTAVVMLAALPTRAAVLTQFAQDEGFSFQVVAPLTSFGRSALTQAPNGDLWMTSDPGSMTYRQITQAGVVTEYNTGYSADAVGIAATATDLYTVVSQGIIKSSLSDPQNPTFLGSMGSTHDLKVVPLGYGNNSWAGDILGITESGNLFTVDTATDTITTHQTGLGFSSNVQGWDFSADGSTLYVATNDNKVWTLSQSGSLTEIADLSPFLNRLSGLAINHVTGEVAATSQDNLYIVAPDFSDAQALLTSVNNCCIPPEGVVFSNDGNSLWYTASLGSTDHLGQIDGFNGGGFTTAPPVVEAGGPYQFSATTLTVITAGSATDPNDDIVSKVWTDAGGQIGTGDVISQALIDSGILHPDDTVVWTYTATDADNNIRSDDATVGYANAATLINQALTDATQQGLGTLALTGVFSDADFAINALIAGFEQVSWAFTLDGQDLLTGTESSAGGPGRTVGGGVPISLIEAIAGRRTGLFDITFTVSDYATPGLSDSYTFTISLSNEVRIPLPAAAFLLLGGLAAIRRR